MTNFAPAEVAALCISSHRKSERFKKLRKNSVIGSYVGKNTAE
jgi:hypothetical protein